VWEWQRPALDKLHDDDDDDIPKPQKMAPLSILYLHTFMVQTIQHFNRHFLLHKKNPKYDKCVAIFYKTITT